MRTSTLALVIIIFGLVGILAIVMCGRKKAVNQLKEIRENRTLRAEVVDTYIAPDSTRHEVIVERILSGPTVYLIDSMKLDSIATILNIREKQINELLRVNARLQGRLKASSVSTDSLRNRTYVFDTKFLDATFAEKDSSLIYEYNAMIGIVKYSKRNGWFGKKYNYIDLSSSDPNMKINGYEQFTIKQRDKVTPWGIGIQAGYYYDPVEKGFRPSVGAGVSYNLIRF